MQLGNDYLLKYNNYPSYRGKFYNKLDEGIGLNRIYLNDLDGKVTDIGSGKYHSVFLTGISI
jgi:hypothetical protein